MNRFEIKIASGSRACEQLLLDDLMRITSERTSASEPKLPPALYLIVPSNSLRDHLLYRVLEHQGKPLVNFRCVTHFEFARYLVEPAILDTTGDQLLLALYVRRAARREASLRRPLGHLKDGFGAVLGTVRDLLDAGFHPSHAEALHEVLAEEAGQVASKAEIARVHSIIRVSQIAAEQLALLGLERPPDLLREATYTLASTGHNRLAEARVLLYGYADATGLVTDFLLALLRSSTGQIYLSHPLVPLGSLEERPSETAGGLIDHGHGSHLLQRLESLGTLVRSEARSAPPDLSFLTALGPEAECRGVADRIRDLIDSGATPEGIGVLARNLTPYRNPLRRQLARLGIPFSAIGLAGPKTPLGNKISALLEVLGGRERTRLDRWLDALGSPIDGVRMFDVRLALASLGAIRLEQVRDLIHSPGIFEGAIHLPVRTGIVNDSTSRHEENSSRAAHSFYRIRLPRREVAALTIQKVLNSGLGLLEAIEVWSARNASIDAHLESLERLLFDHLRWPQEDAASQDYLRTLDQLRGGNSGRIQISYEEFIILLRELFSEAETSNFGGFGGGVQILDVMQARGRTFENLFLMGMNRGCFPRQVHEDPFLPDSLRQVIARNGFGVLPDLQLKLAGIDEERFLFAQILSSSPRVTISWQTSDADSKPLAASALLERFRLAAADSTPQAERFEVATHPLTQVGQAESPARPAFESAIQLGLQGDDKGLVGALECALEEWQEVQEDLHCGPESDRGIALHSNQGSNSELLAQPADLARSRVEIAREIDPPRGVSTGEAAFRQLSPYHGLIGTPISRQDPRQPDHPLFITTLESLARCPWQTFVTRLLRIEPLPDPLGELPHCDSQLVGALVHRVLERIADDPVDDPPKNLDELILTRPRVHRWPTKENLDAIVLAEASKSLRDRGIAVPGMATVLAETIQPILDVAHRSAWPDPVPASQVVTAELAGYFNLSRTDTTTRRIFFKADRAEYVGNRLQLTDYKTGTMFLDLKTVAARRKRLLEKVGLGHLLQAAAYANADSPRSIDGRYLVLDPDLDEDSDREILISSEDSGVLEPFEASVETLLDAWNYGSFFPRLEDAKTGIEPRRCQYCSVSQACIRGDSGARRRLREWVDSRRENEAAAGQAEPWARAMIQAWYLGSESPAAGSSSNHGEFESDRREESSNDS